MNFNKPCLSLLFLGLLSSISTLADQNKPVSAREAADRAPSSNLESDVKLVHTAVAGAELGGAYMLHNSGRYLTRSINLAKRADDIARVNLSKARSAFSKIETVGYEVEIAQAERLVKSAIKAKDATSLKLIEEMESKWWRIGFTGNLPKPRLLTDQLAIVAKPLLETYLVVDSAFRLKNAWIDGKNPGLSPAVTGITDSFNKGGLMQRAFYPSADNGSSEGK